VRTQALFDRYYYSKPGFVGGTELFHALCELHFIEGQPILEVGAGPANPTTSFLSELGPVIGLDVSDEVLGNPNLTEAWVYRGGTMPFPDQSFGLCVSNYALEHVANPRAHFQQISRVLKPGGAYCFRTPNRWHYVTMASSLLPHSIHLRLANKLRRLDDNSHDPWPTVYRANTRGSLRKLARDTGFHIIDLRMIEAEPSYGAANVLLFYSMMAYERIVNSSDLFSSLRVNIFGTFLKEA
jgi:ubiquinone/menaquinone biosynthesis C-methylase UbiE